MLGLDDARALSDLAQTVQSSAGVTFVPALAGLGAPHWNDHATGTISGMTLASTKAHVARATFEAIALQILDVFSAMEKDIGARLDGLMADGGASSNDFLMQLQADLLDRPVSRGDQEEVGALGVAAMARASLGIGTAMDDAETRRFEPGGLPGAERAMIVQNWAAAVARAVQAI
jgi:glycerol kinase